MKKSVNCCLVSCCCLCIILFAGTTNGDLLSPEYTSFLYSTYKSELSALHLSNCPQAETPDKLACKSVFEDIEILYMLIREQKPHQILEIAHGLTFSTTGILLALSKNGQGHLTRIETSEAVVSIESFPLQHVANVNVTFVQGTKATELEALRDSRVDRIVMDVGLAPFSMAYLEALFGKVVRKATHPIQFTMFGVYFSNGTLSEPGA